MELVVRVILNHREPELAGEIEQAQPAVRLESNCRGKLMVRSEEYRAHFVRPAHPFHLIHADTLLVQVDRDNLSSTVLEHADGRLVGQRLNEHDVARANQHTGSKTHTHLAATRYAHVVRSCHDTALCPEHVGD
jgi:hypothetical protein